jgi:antitoxin MazE
MLTTLRKIGNSEGVIIPRMMLAYARLVREVDMRGERGAIVLRRPEKTRAGWAEASRAIAAAGGDKISWPAAVARPPGRRS